MVMGPGGDGMAYSGAKPTSLDYSTTIKVVVIIQVGILVAAAIPSNIWDIYKKEIQDCFK